MASKTDTQKPESYLNNYYVISERFVESYNTQRPTLLDKVKVTKKLDWLVKKKVESLEEIEEYLNHYNQHTNFRLADTHKSGGRYFTATFDAIPQWPHNHTDLWKKYKAGEIKHSYLQIRVQPRINFNNYMFKSQTV